jgi:hypothetical protein
MKKEFKTERDLKPLMDLTRRIMAEAKRLNIPITKKYAKKLALDKLGFGELKDDSPNFRAALRIQYEKR